MSPEPAVAPALERGLDLLAPESRPARPATAEGYLDLLGAADPPSTGVAQDLMLTALVPAIYERWWRPALGRIAKGLLGPDMAEEHRIAHALLDLSAGDVVLDVACGPGNFTRDFAGAVGGSGLAVGIDASPTMLARAAADTASAEVLYVRDDAVALPFRDGSFDAVCCFAALHLFGDPMGALGHMTRVLRPGGRIALFTSCRTRSAPLRMFDGLAGASSGMRMFERDEVVEALRSRGVREIRQRVTGLTQFVGGRLDD